MSATVFSDIPVKFQDVLSTPSGIPSQTFLRASEGLIQLLELSLQGMAFGSFKSDIKRAVTYIQPELDDFPQEAATLQKMVAHEGKPGDKASERNSSYGLLWLMRALKFLSLGFRNTLNNPSEDLSVSFRKAYEGSLKPLHGFAVRPVINMALKASPSRKDFMSRLALGGSADQVEFELDVYTSALEKHVAELELFFAEGDWARGM